MLQHSATRCCNTAQQDVANGRTALRLRLDLGDELAFCWVEDFPLFERGEGDALCTERSLLSLAFGLHFSREYP